ncbi:hypothetical protein [Pseudovibrio sp. POLY-S9]|uniref:hypothetical protein n=1 Tax=Pseudovibrio sp. POLY-S9 TaxID=1576596 RepID=UPI00070A7A9C|nr:hypothetical protein [Pseudovibrio sp. POLY-S9]
MDTQIKTLFAVLGRAALRKKLKVSDKALSAACARGIPASWYLPMVELAKELGRSEPLPPYLFNWKRRDEKKEEGTHVSPL